MTPVQAATSPSRAKRSVKEAVLVGAVDLARAAAVEAADAPGDVGEHLGAAVDEDRLVSHRFAATMKGYHGWSWVVTLARVPRGRNATVCEVELLPGEGAILAPDWLPWADRLRPGDIGPGDVLPFKADDPRLVPGWTPSGSDEDEAVGLDQLALARARALSPTGRAEAAQRWYRGSAGPTSAGAVRSPAECLSCGFLVPLSGSLGQVFGVCANAWSPDDGKVVSLDHGCGAHSETDVEHTGTDWPAPDPLIDELGVELVDLPAPAPVAEPDPAAAEQNPAEPDTVAEQEPVEQDTVVEQDQTTPDTPPEVSPEP